MGLDATVYCNCYRAEEIKSRPPNEELVEIDTNGGVNIVTPDNEKYFEFEEWKSTACEHEDMVLVHHRLGNISAIAEARYLIENISTQKGYSFPVLLDKVLYSGSHSGDHLSLPQITILVSELKLLQNGTIDDTITQSILNDLSDLCEKAISIQNPIVF